MKVFCVCKKTEAFERCYDRAVDGPSQCNPILSLLPRGLDNVEPLESLKVQFECSHVVKYALEGDVFFGSFEDSDCHKVGAELLARGLLELAVAERPPVLGGGFAPQGSYSAVEGGQPSVLRSTQGDLSSRHSSRIARMRTKGSAGQDWSSA